MKKVVVFCVLFSTSFIWAQTSKIWGINAGLIIPQSDMAESYKNGFSIGATILLPSSNPILNYAVGTNLNTLPGKTVTESYSSPGYSYKSTTEYESAQLISVFAGTRFGKLVGPYFLPAIAGNLSNGEFRIGLDLGLSHSVTHSNGTKLFDISAVYSLANLALREKGEGSSNVIKIIAGLYFNNNYFNDSINTPAVNESPISQEHREFKPINFGGKVGWNYSTYDMEYFDDVDFTSGFHVGGFFKYNFNPKWGMQTELNYTTKGADFDTYIWVKDRYGEEHKLEGPDDQPIQIFYSSRGQYLDIPVLLNYSLLKNLKVQLGCSVNFFLSGESKRTEPEFEKIASQDRPFENTYTRKMVSDTYKIKNSDTSSPMYAGVLGLEYNYKKFITGVRYCYDFTKYTKSSDNFIRVLQIYGGMEL